MLTQLENQLFSSIGFKSSYDYHSRDIQINPQQYIHIIYIKSSSTNFNHKIFYLTHGFGGTSLLYYWLMPTLRLYGQIILYDLRGMGFSSKKSYSQHQLSEIIKFFIEPIQIIRKYFNHQKIILVGHSFGAYVSLLYGLYYGENIQKIKAFSAIGITPSEKDYKNELKNISDCYYHLISRFGWKYEITYKTLLKYIACFCKEKVIRKSFEQYDNKNELNQNFVKIITKLSYQPNGSQSLFLKLFDPRVLPKFSIYEHYDKNELSINTQIIYGDNDWVDKKGAQQLEKKYPQKLKVLKLQQIGHQIFFYDKLLTRLIQIIVS